MISGKPVWLATSFTVRPACDRSFAVPPVERISTLRAASSRASSTTPALSETEMSARRMGTSMDNYPLWPASNSSRVANEKHVRPASWRDVASLRAMSGRQAELAQLLAQRPAIDAENAGRTALVAFDVIEHRL